MISFSVKTGDGKETLGIALSQDDIDRLVKGKSIVASAESASLGIWFKDNDRRVFLQPRDSLVVVVPADSKEEIGGLFAHGQQIT